MGRVIVGRVIVGRVIVGRVIVGRVIVGRVNGYQGIDLPAVCISAVDSFDFTLF